MGQLVKNPQAVRETWFDPWVEKSPWRRERLPTPGFWPGEFYGLYSQSMVSQRVRHNWATCTFTFKRNINYIKMNPPQVYMCSPSWTLLPPSSPYQSSGSSQCTSPKHPVSRIEPGLVTYLFKLKKKKKERNINYKQENNNTLLDHAGHSPWASHCWNDVDTLWHVQRRRA